MIKFKQLREKTLTPAEKKKREEIAKAMEKDNPDMPMDKKMAIATAQAKKVAEAVKMSAKSKEWYDKGYAMGKNPDTYKSPPFGIGGAAMDAFRKGRKDGEAAKKESVDEARLRDPADEDDMVATDDDRKAADKNIVMQIRSAADLPKGGTIEFKDGKKTKLTQALAKQLVAKFNSIQKPADKKKFQDMAGASLNGLKQAVRIK